MTLQMHQMNLGPVEAAVHEKWRAARTRIELAKKTLRDKVTARTVAEIDAEVRILDSRKAELLQERLKAQNGEPSIEEVQDTCCLYFDVLKTDMLSRRRDKIVMLPRQIAVYLAKILTSQSLPQIGNRFGGRDHTTILHNVRKIEMLTRIDSQLVDDLDRLASLIMATTSCNSPQTTA